MVRKVAYSNEFKNKVKKVDSSLKVKLKKQIKKIINNPYLGKPMRFTRKGTRELYIAPFRLSYKSDRVNYIIILLDLYHKNQQ
jgi:addiction module RelE/StbE family toxin